MQSKIEMWKITWRLKSKFIYKIDNKIENKKKIYTVRISSLGIKDKVAYTLNSSLGIEDTKVDPIQSKTQKEKKIGKKLNKAIISPGTTSNSLIYM